MRPNLPKWITYLAWGTCFLVAVVLSFKSLREPDLWWILLTGEWILNNGWVPTEDTFSYTQAGQPWINVKWLFEVLTYLCYKLGGPELIFLLQTLVNVLVVWMLARLTQSLRPMLGLPANGLITAGVVLATLFTLFGWEYRIIGRPEMTSHLLTLVFIGLYLKQRQSQGSKTIFWLIPLMVLWTNLHEAYGTGLVIMGTMTAGELFDFWRKRKKETPRPFPKNTLIASVVAVLAVSINPRGPVMIIHPYEIFTQVSDNKFTTELSSFATSYYWQQKEPYLAILLFLVALISVIGMKQETVKSGRKTNTKRSFSLPFGTGFTVILALFAYLSLTAHRNIAFFLLVSAPLLALQLDKLLTRISEKRPSLQLPGWSSLIALGVGFYLLVVTETHYGWFNPRDQYGLEVVAVRNPTSASEFLAANQIEGPAFSDFLISSYLLWDRRPTFKSYIDFRDLDVFPAAFFDDFALTTAIPERFEERRTEYGFTHVILYRQNFSSLHRYLYESADWELAVADPVAAVYLLRNETNEAILAALPELSQRFKDSAPVPISGLAKGLSTIFWPGHVPGAPPPYDIDEVAAMYFMMVGEMGFAEQRARQATQNHINDYSAFYTLGKLYEQLGDFATTSESMNQFYSQGYKAYLQGHLLDPDKFECLKGLGAILARQGKWYQAEQQLMLALEKNNADSEIWALLARVQNGYLSSKGGGNQAERSNNWFEYMEKSVELDPTNAVLHFRLGIGYWQYQRCGDAKKHLTGLKGYPGISQEELNQLKQCKQQCGIKD